MSWKDQLIKQQLGKISFSEVIAEIREAAQHVEVDPVGKGLQEKQEREVARMYRLWELTKIMYKRHGYTRITKHIKKLGKAK